jgi:DNA-binding CsgD family transcriptional regulator
LETVSGRHEEARLALEEAKAISRAGGLLFQFGVADIVSAERCHALGELDAGAALADEAVAMFQVARFPFCIAYALACQAPIIEAQQEADRARRQAEEVLTIARVNGFPREEGRAMLTIARLEQADGSVERAEEVLHEALELFTGSHFPLETIMAVEHLAAVAGVKESFEEAARLLGAAQGARDAIGYPVPPIRLDEHESLIGLLRDTLGAEAFGAAWDEGAALSMDEAVAYASRARGERKRPSHGWESLTPTELQVVGLVREGLTNPQIGERLFISPRTVQTHVAHIFAKLGVKTRAELAAEAVRRNA